MELTIEYVTETKTKDQSRGWKCVCPTCSGNDLWYTPDNHRAFCFECASSFAVTGADTEKQRQFVNEVEDVVFDIPRIREIYNEVNTAYLNWLTPTHRSYLHNRGLDDTAIATFGLGFCETKDLPFYHEPAAVDAGLVTRSGFPSLAGRVTFPYMVDDSVTDLRGRTTGDETPRYKGLTHRGRSRGAIYPFNYERSMNAARDTRFVILTEGEIKAIVADMHGFPTMALPGMTSWRPGLVLTDPGIDVIVAFDSNKSQEDRLRVDRALASLTKRFMSFKVLSLPLLGEDKMDLDYFLLHKRGGYQYFKYLIDNAVTYDFYKALRRF